MAEIIVDQSHCNYHLCLWFENQGGIILFRDAGRVTRGGKGTQRKLLHLFESKGLPIPDVVAILDGTLYLVEIDSLTFKAISSLGIYINNNMLILNYVNEMIKCPFISKMKVAFCKTGVTDLSRRSYLQVMEHGFDYIYFDAPRSIKYVC